MGELKFSGNSQRRKRRALLFHGAFLLDLDLALVEGALLMPSKEPDYRANRSHSEFLVNLSVPAREVALALRSGWQAGASPSDIPLERTAARPRKIRRPGMDLEVQMTLKPFWPRCVNVYVY